MNFKAERIVIQMKKKEPSIDAKKAPAKRTPKPKAEKPKTCRVTFTVRAKEGSRVFLAGTFNDWSPTAKEMTDKKGTGEYAATLSLKAGTYQYKFIIDGIWCADPECADWVTNDHGTLNSVRHVE